MVFFDVVKHPLVGRCARLPGDQTKPALQSQCEAKHLWVECLGLLWIGHGFRKNNIKTSQETKEDSTLKCRHQALWLTSGFATIPSC